MSRMNSPIEQCEKSTEAIFSTQQRRTSVRHHAKSASESDDDDEESDEDEAKKPATRDKPKRSKLKDQLSIIRTATEIQGQEMMMFMKHVNLTVQGDRNTETRTK